jgi:hypothetical protein
LSDKTDSSDAAPSLGLEREGSMDIHKPKAAHNWRGFAIEIGTIICGILIALSLEQVVESLHRRAEVAETREALKREISQNVAVARIAWAENLCTVKRGETLAAWAKGGPRHVPTEQRYMSPLRTSVWDYSKTGAVARMPLEEALAFASYYDAVIGFNDNVRGQHETGRVVGGLSLEDKLSPSQAERLLQAANSSVSEARYQVDNAVNIIAKAEKLGAELRRPSPATREHVEKYCTQSGMPAPTL